MKKMNVQFSQHSIERFFQRVNSEFFRHYELSISDNHYKIKNRMLKLLKLGKPDNSFLNDKIFLGKLQQKHGYDREIKFIYNRDYGIVFVILKTQFTDIVLTVLSKVMARVDKVKYNHLKKKKELTTFAPQVDTIPSVVKSLAFDFKDFFNNTKPIETIFNKPIHLNLKSYCSEPIKCENIRKKLTQTRGQYTNNVNFLYIHYEEENEIMIYHKASKKDKNLFLDKYYALETIMNDSMMKHQVQFNDYLLSLVAFTGPYIKICVDPINQKAFVFQIYNNYYYLSKVYNIIPK